MCRLCQNVYSQACVNKDIVILHYLGAVLILMSKPLFSNHFKLYRLPCLSKRLFPCVTKYSLIAALPRSRPHVNVKTTVFRLFFNCMAVVCVSKRLFPGVTKYTLIDDLRKSRGLHSVSTYRHGLYIQVHACGCNAE